MLNKQMREAQLNKNTVQLNLKQALSKKSEIIDSYKDSQIQVAEIGKEIESVLQQQSLVSGNLENLNSSTESSQKEIDELTSLLESKKQEEAKHLTDSEHVKIEYSSLLQKESFIDENKSRLESEISRLNQEKEEINASELPLENQEDFIRLIYVRLYGQRKNMGYEIETTEEREVNGFRFKDFQIRRRENGTSGRNASERKG